MGEMADLAREEAERAALEGDDYNDPVDGPTFFKMFGLGELIMSFFGGPRKLRADQWCTADRVVWRISKMKTSHVLNALNFIHRKNGRAAVGARRMNNLEREGRKRGLIQLEDGSWRGPHGFDVVDSRRGNDI